MVGVLSDDTDPMVTVMKLEKAPTESYADIGGNTINNEQYICMYILYIALVPTFHYID